MRSVEVRAHSADTTNMYPHAQNERMRICTCAYEYIVNKSELACTCTMHKHGCGS
jgi:hypothetical protein